MIEIDGAKLDLTTREFTYHLPEPFGPDRGPAFLTIWARPVSSQNVEWHKKFRKLIKESRAKDMLRERRLEKTNDTQAYVESQMRDAEHARKAGAEIRYDECIERWETNIQSNGQNLEPTRENFVALGEFEHEDIVELFNQITNDLNDFERWRIEIQNQEMEEDKGN